MKCLYHADNELNKSKFLICLKSFQKKFSRQSLNFAAAEISKKKKIIKMASLVYLVLLTRFQTGFCALNMFLPISEVRSLLGVAREMSLASEGVLKRHALNKPISISEHVDEISFTWFNDDDLDDLEYDLKVDVEDVGVLHQPQINISHSGFVPKIATSWRIKVRCLNEALTNVAKGKKKSRGQSHVTFKCIFRYTSTLFSLYSDD